MSDMGESIIGAEWLVVETTDRKSQTVSRSLAYPADEIGAAMEPKLRKAWRWGEDRASWGPRGRYVGQVKRATDADKRVEPLAPAAGGGTLVAVARPGSGGWSW